MANSGYIRAPQAQASLTPTSKTLTLEAEAQQVLDELWSEQLTPIPLKVGKLTKAVDEYTIHFYDARIHSAKVPLTKGHSFRDLVRKAVLDRVSRISGPLRNRQG